MLGLRRIARARASRCFWPPEMLAAQLADARLVAARQVHDEVVGEGLAGRRLHLLRRRPPRAVGDVVEDRVVEQDHLLRHDADLLAQAAQVDGAEVVAVDEDAAVVGVVEARQQAQQRRSCRSRSARPRRSSRRRGRRDGCSSGSAAPGRRRSRRRGTRCSTAPSRPLPRRDVRPDRQARAVAVAADARLAVEEGEDAVGGGAARLDAREHAGQLAHRVGDGRQEDVQAQQRLGVQRLVGSAARRTGASRSLSTR